ncbi:MAG TPA: thioredoxin-dependent thiol peroxidase [Bacilli bacterium]|nr:thioredoxin-dependent thiol peroxidase [Bacilli bacterium]
MIKKGNKAPDFTLFDTNNKSITLSSFRGQKVVLYFYPKDNTPGCTVQAKSFRDYDKELQELGYTVIGISRDTVKTHFNFKLKHELPFVLLADPEREVIKKYGVLKEKMMFGKRVLGTERSTFVINEEGVITDIFKNVNAAKSSAELVDYLREKAQEN